jgi:hypothetical protein
MFFPQKFPPNDSHAPQSILFGLSISRIGVTITLLYRVADTSLHQFYQDTHLDPRPDVWKGTGAGPGVPRTERIRIGHLRSERIRTWHCGTELIQI